MKINKYQIVVVNWGLMMMIGYLLTDFVNFDPAKMLFVWTATIAFALFVQAALMWYEKIDGYLTHATWLLVALSGSVATYLKFYAIIENSIHITTMWFALCAAGMLATGYFQKNWGYLLLAVMYGAFALVYQITVDIELTNLLVPGIAFFVLGIIDALLEYSPLRGHLANFEEERVV